MKNDEQSSVSKPIHSDNLRQPEMSPDAQAVTAALFKTICGLQKTIRGNVPNCCKNWDQCIRSIERRVAR